MFLLPSLCLSTVNDAIRETETAIRADLVGLKKADFVIDAFHMLLKARETAEGKVALCRELTLKHAAGSHQSWKASRRKRAS